jgi:hypothetical protein
LHARQDARLFSRLQQRLAIFVVSSNGQIGRLERTLVYDPSDSEAHENDIPYNNYDGSFTRHRHLIGHFYVIENSPWKGCALQKATC